MKYDLSIPLRTFDGKLFTRALTDENGQAVVEDGKVKQAPLTFKQMLESVCLNADPQEYSSGERKMLVFNILMKVHSADPIVDLSAEDVAILKNLVGKQLLVGAVGVVYKALESPLSE